MYSYGLEATEINVNGGESLTSVVYQRNNNTQNNRPFHSQN